MQAISMRNPFFIFFVLVSCSVMGQVTNKKQLTEADYHLWSTMEMQAVSVKGNWVSYHLAYESGMDTLFVRNKEATKTYSFAKGYDGRFAKDGSFACMLPDNVLSVLNLKTGVVRQIKGVVHYAFSGDGNTLVTLTDAHQLIIERLDGSGTETIASVSEFYVNPTSTGMVYTIAKERASLHYCPFDGNREHFQRLVTDGEATFENVVWQRKGASFAFVQHYKDTLDIRNGKNLYLYRLVENKLYSFDANAVSTIAKDSIIESPIWTRFTISDDGQRVFFYLTEASVKSTEKPIVQVWNGNDAWPYPQVQQTGRFDKASKCAVWWPDSGRFLQITSAEQPKLMLSGDQQYAVTYNPMGNIPQFGYNDSADFYITDLNTGQRTNFLTNQLCDLSEVTASYGGKYIAYFKNKKWWVYDIAHQKHINICTNITEPLLDEKRDYSGPKPAFGIAGWTQEDKEVLLYDEYDLWSVSLTDLKAKRLTKGREQGISFRLVFPLGEVKLAMNFDGFTFRKLDLNNTLYLQAFEKETKRSGFYVWHGAEKPIVFKDKSITQFGYTTTSDTYYYAEQDFDAPPAIMAIGKFKNKVAVVVQSNPHHANYHWGKSQLIRYTNSKNQSLQGVLYYPANYDSTKKYPMVVYIYEKLSQHLHTYVNPTLHNNIGINTSNLNAQGYLVLHPDISYAMDDVGISATDCVVSATKAVIAMGIAQADKIALTGHSFGGYEADFIATQTDIFATIISGAGSSDLVNTYLSIGWNTGKPEAWRFEDHQYRMERPMYANMEGFLRNSPVMQASKITTPMLIWTGEQDRQVHYYQSIEFYNALRRLGKKTIMLVYPNNGHILTESDSREDFTHRFEQWLATYLKNTSAPEWIAKGMQ
jgi:fermentation-respiration switch protein FrsA (DUF1100 family)